MTRIVIVLAVLAALGGCKKKSGGDHGETLAKMNEFADMMCQCKDKACADAVQERMTKWSTDMAASAGTSRPQRLDDATVKKMTELGQKYAECMTRAFGPPEPPPPPENPLIPAAVPAPATVEALLASARTWARGEHPQFQIVRLDFQYIGADGVVDPTFGKVTIELGSTAPVADDPKRRTGSPVMNDASRPTWCTELSWTTYGWKKVSRARCPDASPPFPRCPVATVWKRAIEKGAPADALAVVTLSESTPRQWTFAISDELRKVAISHRFDDDCELAVEKP